MNQLLVFKSKDKNKETNEMELPMKILPWWICCFKQKFNRNATFSPISIDKCSPSERIECSETIVLDENCNHRSRGVFFTTTTKETLIQHPSFNTSPSALLTERKLLKPKDGTRCAPVSFVQTDRKLLETGQSCAATVSFVPSQMKTPKKLIRTISFSSPESTEKKRKKRRKTYRAQQKQRLKTEGGAAIEISFGSDQFKKRKSRNRSLKRVFRFGTKKEKKRIQRIRFEQKAPQIWDYKDNDSIIDLSFTDTYCVKCDRQNGPDLSDSDCIHFKAIENYFDCSLWDVDRAMVKRPRRSQPAERKDDIEEIMDMRIQDPALVDVIKQIDHLWSSSSDDDDSSMAAFKRRYGLSAENRTDWRKTISTQRNLPNKTAHLSQQNYTNYPPNARYCEKRSRTQEKWDRFRQRTAAAFSNLSQSIAWPFLVLFQRARVRLGFDDSDVGKSAGTFTAWNAKRRHRRLNAALDVEIARLHTQAENARKRRMQISKEFSPTDDRRIDRVHQLNGKRLKRRRKILQPESRLKRSRRMKMSRKMTNRTEDFRTKRSSLDHSRQSVSAVTPPFMTSELSVNIPSENFATSTPKRESNVLTTTDNQTCTVAVVHNIDKTESPYRSEEHHRSSDPCIVSDLDSVSEKEPQSALSDRVGPFLVSPIQKNTAMSVWKDGKLLPLLEDTDVEILLGSSIGSASGSGVSFRVGGNSSSAAGSPFFISASSDVDGRFGSVDSVFRSDSISGQSNATLDENNALTKQANHQSANCLLTPKHALISGVRKRITSTDSGGMLRRAKEREPQEKNSSGCLSRTKDLCTRKTDHYRYVQKESVPSKRRRFTGSINTESVPIITFSTATPSQNKKSKDVVELNEKDRLPAFTNHFRQVKSDGEISSVCQGVKRQSKSNQPTPLSSRYSHNESCSPLKRQQLTKSIITQSVPTSIFYFSAKATSSQKTKLLDHDELDESEE